jgi:putative FmdB family regulatory protein
MSLYDFECRDCKKKFTVVMSFKKYDSNPKIACPDCKKGNVDKKFTAFFAKTDKNHIIGCHADTWKISPDFLTRFLTGPTVDTHIEAGKS